MYEIGGDRVSQKQISGVQRVNTNTVRRYGTRRELCSLTGGSETQRELVRY